MDKMRIRGCLKNPELAWAFYSVTMYIVKPLIVCLRKKLVKTYRLNLSFNSVTDFDL